jgi:SAM-dependent methyltransferase
MKCSVCSGTQFSASKVLWAELADDWELSDFEIEYIDRQQGECCVSCGSNLRSIVLAKAIIDSYGESCDFQSFISLPDYRDLKVIEINPAGNLTSILQQLTNHSLVTYPEFDMANLAIESGVFDLVVHSDTLEHVDDMMAGLSECRRILAPGGRCIFTVPIIVDRQTRSRKGLKKSYHGGEEDILNDYIVHTEFGMDTWKFVLEAGFKNVTMHSLSYPAALAIEARI